MAMHAATLPAREIGELRATLSRQYGARVVDEGDRRILLIRVPRVEPDPVNDVEAAIEYLDPRDVEGATHCILVGDDKISQVYATPLQGLMEDRVRFDAEQVLQQRADLPDELAFSLYKASKDPRRRWRLAVRLPIPSVRELTETILEELADQMGSKLEHPQIAELAAVYLIANQDDVRMEPDHFIQELRKTWQDEERKRAKIAERAAMREEVERRQAAERRHLLKELGGRFHEAPKTPRRVPAIPRDEPIATSSDVLGRVDHPVADAIGERNQEIDDLTARVDSLTRRAKELRPGDDVCEALSRKLTLEGYDVLLDPDTPYAIDVAAEREAGPMQRIVFRLAARLTVPEADELLKMARELDVDQVFCVAEQADEEAKRRIVATKVTWFRPHEMGSLRL